MLHTFASIRDGLTELEKTVTADRLTAEEGFAAALAASVEALAAETERADTATAELDALKVTSAEALAAERARADAATSELDDLKMAIQTAVIATKNVIDVPDHIASDGSADVGAELTAWLNTIQGPATVRFPAFGIFRIDDAAVQVEKPAGVVYDFNGSTLLRTRIIDLHLRYPGPGRFGFFRLQHPTGVTVKGLRVQGQVRNDGSMDQYADEVIDGKPYLLDRRGVLRDFEYPARMLPPYWPVAGEWGVWCTALAFEHGIDLTRAVNTTIEDCWLEGMGGDGVGTTVVGTKNVTIRRVTVRRNGRQGISICAGSGFLIEDCDIRSARAAIDIEPDHVLPAVTDIEIRNCRLDSHLLPFAAGGRGEVHNVYIHHNVIGVGGVPITHVMSNENGGYERRNWRFEDNTVLQEMSSAAALVRWTNVHDSTVLRNKIARRPGQAAGRNTAVQLTRCSGVIITDNDFPRADPVLQEIDPVAPAICERNTV